MKFKIFLILIISFSLYSFIDRIIPENEFHKLLEERIELYNKEKQREFIYLMNDKPFYKPGENIWFGAWVTDGNFLKPTKLSQKLYVELINPKGKVEKKLILPISGGRSNGDFELEGYCAGGIYKLRAYTYYANNFGKQHVFEKEITVQKIIMPRLLMKLDFQKKAYGAGDEVKADFSVTNLENQALAKQQLKYSVYIKGKLLSKENMSTNNEGEAVVRFQLPEKLETNDGLLNIQLEYNGEKESISRSIPILLKQMSLSFHPEGGNLIADKKNVLAFKALNEFGKPADFEANLYNEKNELITTLSSYYQGYGVFDFTPTKNQRYKVKITKPVGVEKEYFLPEAIEKAYSIHLTENQTSVLKLTCHAPTKDSLFFVATIRDKIYHFQKIIGNDNLLVVNTKDWPSGIAKLTLFDKNKIPVAERMTYIGVKEPMKITIEADKKYYQPGEKVRLKVVAKTHGNKPVKSKLAITVVENKLYTFADDRQNNILSSLLMSNELKETIEEPLYYFNNEKEKAWKALDFVLMCSKSTRYPWLEILNKQPKISFLVEKPSIFSGQVIDKSTGKGIKTTVWLSESNYGNVYDNGRTASVKTTADGHFSFCNVHPYSWSLCFVKSDNKKLVILGPGEILPPNELSQLTKESPTKLVINKQSTQKKKMKFRISLPSINWGGGFSNSSSGSGSGSGGSSGGRASLGGGLSMESSGTDIQECIVVGYGTPIQRFNNGSIAFVGKYDLEDQNYVNAVVNKIEGVYAVRNTVGANDKTKVGIREISSISNNANPLVIIDGIPILQGQNQQDNPLSFINPSEISYISVSKSGGANSFYSSQASNGVIEITTKQKYVDHFFSQRRKKSPYVSRLFYDRENCYTKRKRFDAYIQSMETDSKRTDFRTTVHWDPLVETDENGEATITFNNTDEVSSFKIIAEGISVNGEPGRGEAEYHTNLPIHLAAKMPPFVCFFDTVKIPLIITNNTESAINGSLNVNIPTSLTSLSDTSFKINVAKGKTERIYLSYFVKNIEGLDSLSLSFKCNGFEDELKNVFEVIPVGFPQSLSFSDQKKEQEYEFELKDMLDGSLNIKYTALSSILADMHLCVEGLLREPHGCFEQTSATSYPNLLVVDYLKTVNKKDDELFAKANRLLEDGYYKLIDYETYTRGYEWFGRSPGNQALTAYGLLQFMDMKKHCSYVDDKMIKRTANWLLNSRNEKGGFKRSKSRTYFGNKNDLVYNAYIVYALSQAGYGDLQKEFSTSYNAAVESKDAYTVALMANTALATKQNEKANNLLNMLYESQNENGSWTGTHYSITYSSGKSLAIETTSLAIMAILEAENPDKTALDKAIKFLIKSKNALGAYGATQSTILALKAITQYTINSKKVAESGMFEIFIDDKKVAQRKYEKDQEGSIIVKGLEQYVNEGKHKLKIKFSDCNKALPYSFVVNWYSATPESSKKCNLDIDCKLQSEAASLSDVVRMSVNLTNKENYALPMSMAKIGIPGGLTPQPWQLKELHDKKIIDYYEIFDNYLVFYFTEIAAKEKKQINLDLKADMAGVYQGAASCAYLYYTNEEKTWLEGMKIRINE